MPKRSTKTKSNASDALSDLVLRLAIAADGHTTAIAGVLGIGKCPAAARLRRKKIRTRWYPMREKRRAEERRARVRRAMLRGLLRNLGIDPVALPPSDPLWPYCNRWPRGHFVNVVAAQMRRERPGEPLATLERLPELLERVAALAAASPVEVARATADAFGTDAAHAAQDDAPASD